MRWLINRSVLQIASQVDVCVLYGKQHGNYRTLTSNISITPIFSTLYAQTTFSVNRTVSTLFWLRMYVPKVQCVPTLYHARHMCCEVCVRRLTPPCHIASATVSDFRSAARLYVLYVYR